MKDLLSGPLFKVGDIIRSDYDRPTLITKIKNIRGYYHYEGLRQDPEDIKVNGPTIHYSQASIARFYVIGFNPAVATLFS